MSLPRPGFDGIPANAIVHSCGSWWTGTRRVHCPAAGCHLTFSSETAANKHRAGVFGVDRRCIDPAEAGLVARAAKFGTVWCCPGPEADNETAAWRPTPDTSEAAA
ncbi:MAG: hypothetical protein LBV60_16120 [Streptomyces sp.]|jgi:hypothetical protein|nr:hypothetical protein [Streptomyces sp.]